MRAMHSMGPLALDGQEVRSALHEPALSEKTALWQSLNRPLQPAVYLTLEGRPSQPPPAVRHGLSGAEFQALVRSVTDAVNRQNRLNLLRRGGNP